MNFSQFQLDLKEHTTKAHQEAESHPFMQSMINGTYNKEQLLQFLVNLYPVYVIVEQRLLKEKIKDLPELKRSSLIELDINKLIEELNISKPSPLLTPRTCMLAWISNCWAKPVSLLKAELYSRWLADFYGGRMLSKTVSPCSMYMCDKPKEVIDAVRSVLDELNENEEITNEDIIQEVISFFNLHTELFDEIYNGNS